MTSPRRLVAVPGTAKRDHYDDRCRVAVRAVTEGIQDVRVQAATPLAGPGHGQIAVRVGRVLVYVNDRDALASFLKAWSEAEDLAEKAFGPVPPPPQYRPRH